MVPEVATARTSWAPPVSAVVDQLHPYGAVPSVQIVRHPVVPAGAYSMLTAKVRPDDSFRVAVTGTVPRTAEGRADTTMVLDNVLDTVQALPEFLVLSLNAASAGANGDTMTAASSTDAGTRTIETRRRRAAARAADRRALLASRRRRCLGSHGGRTEKYRAAEMSVSQKIKGPRSRSAHQVRGSPMSGTLMVGRAVKSSRATGVESSSRLASPAVVY